MNDYTMLSPEVWAYLGDAVFELLARQHFVGETNVKPKELHRLTTKVVNAEAQAKMLQRLQPELTEAESDIVRRGRNSTSRPSPKGASVQDYRYSTGFEALFGYLYLKGDMQRAMELFAKGIREE